MMCSVGVSAQMPASGDAIVMDRMVVTATREVKSSHDVPESVGVIDQDDVSLTGPAHPSELLNRVPGVHINNLGGEGHMTAIRQPITTSGVYLFLEDGVPIRPTGLFNHNALYEVNIPQAHRIEIIRGPGSALYGSDSIGGIIHSMTKPSPDTFELQFNPEYGGYGWKRLLTTVGTPLGESMGARVDINLTENDGFRYDADYTRYSVTGRLDVDMGTATSIKTISSYSRIRQKGVSALGEDDYKNNIRKNDYKRDVGRRNVEAFRLSSEVSYEPNNVNLLTGTAFFRRNRMVLMPVGCLIMIPMVDIMGLNRTGF